MVSESVKKAPMPVRFRFRKTGALQYISHLDLNRTLQKALLRARIPVWYTEGFNPKPRLNFAAPLSVGCQSECELCDIKIVSDMDLSRFPAQLSAVLPPELAVSEAYTPDSKFTGIHAASYEIRIVTAGASEAFAEEADRILHAPINIVKRTKSGEKETDILPLIHKAETAFEDGELVIRCVLSCTSESYLNPEYVVQALKNAWGILSGDPMEERYSIMRREFYREDGTVFR